MRSVLSVLDLGALAITEALRRGGVLPGTVDYVIMGHVLQAGQGQNPARQAAVGAGVPMDVPAMTVNKVCLSSLNALYLADLMIAAGEAEVVIAGGMESMSQAPYLLDGARAGLGFGDTGLRDDIVADGLSCAFDQLTMGCATDRDAAAASITRQEQDAVAVRSHDRAAAATKAGRLAEEIVPVSVARRRGDPILVLEDEGIRPGTTQEQLAGLRSAFSDGGTITAGNASQISDGAAALVVAAPAAAARLGVSPLAEVVSYGQVAGPGTSLLTQPSRGYRLRPPAWRPHGQRPRGGRSQRGVCGRRRSVGAGPFHSRRHPEPERRRHRPRPSTRHVGSALALTLSYELSHRGGTGVAALCGGGGQGDALVLRSLGA